MIADLPVDGTLTQARVGPVPAAPLVALPIPPLAVGGLVLTRAALVAALRLYVPQAVDVSVLDDDRFLLHLADDVPAA